MASFSAVTDNPEATKVAISDDYLLTWEKGDRILINDGSMTRPFVADKAGSNTVFQAEGVVLVEDKTYVAAYPELSCVFYEGELKINVADTLAVDPGKYPQAPAVAVGNGKDRLLEFKNVCGLVSFTVTGTNVQAITISGADGETVAGLVQVNPETAEYTVLEGKDKIVLKSNVKAFYPGKYYVPLLPGDYKNGIKVDVTVSGSDAVMDLSYGPFDLQASQYVDLESLDNIRWVRYEISDAEQLKQFLLDAPECKSYATALLTRDINLAGVALPSVESYAGTFDGSGYALKNWSTSAPLFSSLGANGLVKNLTIDASCSMNIAATDSLYMSYVVGRNHGTVSGCVNKAALKYEHQAGVTFAARALGSLVGYSTGTVYDCHNEGAMSMILSGDAMVGSRHNIGGVVGMFSSKPGTEALRKCSNGGELTVRYAGLSEGMTVNVAGVCAQGCDGEEPLTEGEPVNAGTVRECSNSGAVSVELTGESTGGTVNMAGVTAYVEGTVDGCVNDGAVAFSSSLVSAPVVGGVLAAVVSGNVLDCKNNAAVSLVSGAGTLKTMIGGVAAKIGTQTENTTYTIKDCVNSGTVTMEGTTEELNLGGIVGWTSLAMSGSDANKLLNSGALLVNTGTTLKNCYLGGVVGYSISTYDKVYNTGEITVNLDNSTENQAAYIAGIAGYMAKVLDGTTAKQGINKGNLTVSGGNPNSAKRSYIAGVVARTMAHRISSNGTKWVESNSNYANITVNSPLTLTIGGVLGELNAARSSGKNGATSQCKHQGIITVTSPGKNSYIGGVIGMHGRGQLGNANGFGESDTKLGKIVVTGADASTYVGGYFGYLDTDNGAGTTISGCGLRGEISAEGATVGVIAGYVGMTGKSCKNVIKLGTSATERPKISKTFKLNGAVVGNFSLESVEESHYFGKIAPSKTSGNTVAGQYFFQAGGITGNLASFKEGLLNL